MLFLIALLAAFAGFTGICVSMAKHQREVWKEPLERHAILALRVSGAASLLLAWAISCRSWGLGMGTVAWVCLIGLAPLILVFGFAYRPKLTIYAAGLSVMAAVTLSLAAVLTA